jgi:pimeloyl-ACP methyl ester carboxylesterase
MRVDAQYRRMNHAAPTRHRLATRPGFEIAWYAWGAPAPESPVKPVLLLLHGFLDVALSFDAVARVLAADWHVIAPDHRGHGDSDRVGAGGYYHFPDYVHDVAALADAVAPATFALAGHSMGASIACYYAGSHPERVRALALLDGIGPAAASPDQGPRQMRRWLNDLRLLTLREEPVMDDLETVAQRLQRTAPFATAPRLLELAAHAARRDPDGRWRWRFDPLHRTVGPTPFDVQRFMAFLRAIRCPTLVLRGEKSPMWENDAESRVACLQQVERDTLAGAAHNLHHERPLELATRLAAFLARHRDATGDTAAAPTP